MFDNNVWNGFEEKRKELFHQMNGRRIVIWGYGYTGQFIEHLLRRHHRNVDCIIDSNAPSNKLKVYNPIILEELDPEVYYVVLTFKYDSGVDKILTELGYAKGYSFIFVRELFYGISSTHQFLSYMFWTDYKCGTNFAATEDELNFRSGEKSNYSPGCDYSLVDIADAFEFTEDDALFDFGCGKGWALTVFHNAGIRRIGGVEYNQKLYNILLNNFGLLNIPADRIMLGDATDVTDELDGYNFFFMYNSFVGETFDKVIKNLEDSFIRNKRKIVLIYVGAVCHKSVIRNGYFKLKDKIYTDYWCRNANIYVCE